MTPAENPPRRHRRRTILLAVAGALAIAVHIGLLGAVLANSRWTSGAADIVLMIVVGKALLILGGRVAFRHGKAAYRIRHTRTGIGGHHHDVGRDPAVSDVDTPGTRQ